MDGFYLDITQNLLFIFAIILSLAFVNKRINHWLSKFSQNLTLNIWKTGCWSWHTKFNFRA